MTTTVETVLCQRCGPQPLKGGWIRVMPRHPHRQPVPVVAGDKIVGWVAVLRCRTCSDYAAIPVKA